MIDTVRSDFQAPWREGAPTPSGCKVVTRPCAVYDNGGVRKVATPQRLVEEGDGETGSGLRIGGSDFMAEWVEVSLPRLLFGHNGRVIENQDQVNDALSLVRQRLTYWCDYGRRNFDAWHFTRVDLVQQFRGSPGVWCAAFSETTHPMVRRKAREFFGRGLSWDGSETQIRLYDKMLEASKNKVQDGDVVRFEVQLRGEALRKRLATEIDKWTDRKIVTRLDFARCYSEYRKILLHFQPVRVARPPFSKEGLIAFCHHHGFKVDGVPFLTLIRPVMSRRSWCRIQRAIKEFRPEFTRIDLAALLPASSPTPVHVTDTAAANGLPVAAALSVA